MCASNNLQENNKKLQNNIWMKDRRPLQPEVANSKEFRSSYFSDRIPISFRKEKTFEELQNLNLGKYSGSTSKLVSYIPFREEFCGVYSVAFSTDGSVLVIGLGNGDVQVFDKKNDSLRKVLNSSLVNNPITCIKLHPLLPALFYTASISGIITLSSFEGESKFLIAESNNEVNTLDTDIYGIRLITAGKDACIRTYNPESKQLIQMYGTTNYKRPSSTDSHKMRIYCLKFHPTFHNIFASGGWDGTVKIWDVRTNSGLVRAIEGPFINGDAIDLQDNKILTGSNRGKNNLQMWDLGSGLLIDNIVPHNRLVSLDGDQLYTAKFFSGEPNGDLVMCGGGGYGSLRVISLKENLIVAEFPEKKPIVTSCCFENEISYGTKGGNCYVVKYFIGGETGEEEVDNAINEDKEMEGTSHGSIENKTYNTEVIEN